MFFKRFMAVVLTIAMLCSSLAFAEGETLIAAPSENTQPPLTQEEINKNATGFIDIAPEASYAPAVKKLVEYGIIAGYPDGTFKPEGEVTRAEMCKMINLTLGYVDFEGAEGFPDVTVNNWYYAYALAAQKQGYVEGYDDNTFRGSNNITRQEVCAILNRLLKPMNLGIPVTITDPVANWARPHVELIVQNFIMPLEENNTFRATENLKRHELATVLSNMAIGPVKQIDADVRFFVNGEQYGETQTIVVGNTIVVPEDPKTPGSDYVFDGWRQIGTDGIVDVKSVIVIADIDYEAVFSKKLHDVTFISRGAVYETRVALHGDVVEAPENPEVKGYEFLGWSLSEDGTVVKLSETPILDNVNFYAVYEKIESGGGGGAAPAETLYSVKFFVNGDLYDIQKLLKNDSPKTPDDPLREGYIFIGWSLTKDGEIVNPVSINVTKSITLYAVFEKEEEEEPEVFTVNFYADGKKHDTQFVEAGNTVSSVPNPSKEGYIFKYWSKSENGTEVKLGYYTVNSNTDFFAVFEKEEEEITYFTVTFMADGKEYSSSKIQEGNKASAPTAPSKEGYNFKGWSRTEGGSVSSVSVAVTENITFYAVFEKIEPKKFTVTFYIDGDEYDAQTVVEGESPEAPAIPSKDGYTFKGWAETSTGEPVNIGSYLVNSSKNFYAVFEKKEAEVKSFTVTFYVDGKKYDSQEIVEGEKVKVPDDPEKANHNFVGWSKTDGGSVVAVDTVAKANAEYYAVFEVIKKYTVTFYVDGKLYKEVTVVDGEAASAPSNPYVEGYTFKGWSKTIGADIVNVGSVMITSNTSFYAVLEKKEAEKVYYDVIFMSDGARYDSQSVVEGGFASEPDEPEKKDYTFKGWSKSNGGSIVDVETVEINAKTTFYAVFEKNPVYYEVVFVVDGDEYDVQEVLEGECPEVPNDPVLDGYEFTGWSKSEGGSTVYPDRTPVSSNTVYYAVFEEAEEEIVYYNVVFWFDGEHYKSYETAAGDTVKAPSIPELEDGVSFLGWSLDDSNDPDEIIEVSDIIITGHTDFYSVLVENPNSSEFMEKLSRGHKQLKNIKRATGLQKEAINLVTECIGYVLEDAENGTYIDKSYVVREYGEMVEQVKTIVNVDMSSSVRSQFVNLITSNVEEDIQNFLFDYFDIDTNV